MSLFVVFKELDKHGYAKQIELYVPFTKLPAFDSETIDMIVADGDELKAILDHFITGSIPTPNLTSNQRRVRWYGDIACTIYFNL